MQPSDLLSRAAGLIRDTAAETTKPRRAHFGWGYLDEDEIGGDPANGTVIVSSGWGGSDRVAERVGWGDARWIALMSPAVAELLINWLEAEIACIVSVDDVQRIMPKILDGIESGAGDEDTAITVTVDTSGPALAFARHVIAVLGEKEDTDG